MLEVGVKNPGGSREVSVASRFDLVQRLRLKLKR